MPSEAKAGEGLYRARPVAPGTAPLPNPLPASGEREQSPPHPLVMPDHLLDDEPEERLRERRVQFRLLRQPPEPRDLRLFPPRIGGRQPRLVLVPPHRLRHLEPLGEQVDQRRVDIVDAPAITAQHLVAHPTSSRTHAFRARTDAPRKGCVPSASPPHRGHAMTAAVHRLRAGQPSLDPLMSLVQGDMNAVNTVILGRMQSEIPLIPELAGHLIAGGGKRMRPMLTLSSARLIGYTGTRHHRLAAAVEFIHTATLLHDDVVDGSDLRRGKRTANIIWGNPASVLVGDFLFSRSFELMVEDGSLTVLKILSNASAVIAEGEVNQLTAARRIDIGEDRYLDIIGAKTAALFAAACRIAAVVAERPEAEERALDAYGRNLGIAFQLVDDAIDYISDAGTMGKDAGDDFREGKMTLPVILAHARGNADERRFWKDAVEGRRASDDDFAHAIVLVRRSRAVDDTVARARHYGQRAIDAIGGFGGGRAKDAMVEAVEFAVSRAY